MKYKLVLLDLDGTTVASKGDALPSQRVIDAVASASEYLTVAIATGRPYELALPVIEKLGLTGPAVFNGGAEIINMGTKEVIARQVLSIETLKELVYLAIPFGYDLYPDNDQYGKPLSSPEEVLQSAAKLFIEAVPTHEAIHILEQLNGVPSAAAHPTTSWEDGDVVDIHVTHVDATKRHGAEQLTEMLGFSKEDVIAIGDGHNDMPLLEAAGLKVAMGNAPDEVKELADYVTASQSEDGVAVAIERFVLENEGVMLA